MHIKDVQGETVTKANRFPNEERIVSQLNAAMLRKLALNRHKGTWELTTKYLMQRLRQEVEELGNALDDGLSSESIINECADVANFAAMIMDVVIDGAWE